MMILATKDSKENYWHEMVQNPEEKKLEPEASHDQPFPRNHRGLRLSSWLVPGQQVS